MTATSQTPRLPRVKFKATFSVAGLCSGAVAGFGLLVVLQQFSVAAPTRNLAILLAGVGALVGLLGGNIGRVFAMRNMNKRLAAVERRFTPADADEYETPAPAAFATPAVAAVVAAPVAAPVVADDDEDYVEDDATDWQATHVVPAAGMAAWSEPDNTGPPITQLEGGVQLRVLSRENGLAEIEAYNGWTAWVESRRLRRVQS